MANCLATLPSVYKARGPEDCIAPFKYSWEKGFYCQERYPALRRITVPNGGIIPSSGVFRGRYLRAITRGFISASKGSTSSSLCGKRQYRQTSWSPKRRVTTTARAPKLRISTIKRSWIIYLHGSPYCAVKAPVQSPRSWVLSLAEEAMTNWSRRRLSARYVIFVASSQRKG